MAQAGAFTRGEKYTREEMKRSIEWNWEEINNIEARGHTEN